MRIRFIVLGVLCGAALSVLFGGRAEAVQLKLVPAVGRHAIGGEFAVDVKIDTEEKAINAAQATIVFPPHLLEVKEVSREGSLFTFWLDEPRFANEKGTVQFVGGTHTGISGGSIQVTRIVFMTKRSGTALVSFEEAAVTASDGSGTNILTALHGAQFVLVEDAGGPAPPPPPALAPPPPVTRPATPAANLPPAPKLRTALYPDPDTWYNVSAPFLVQWQLPGEVSDVSTAVNRVLQYTPPRIPEGLTEGRIVDGLSDGIWYIHARFQNNVGWGPAAHYRVAVDTVPPEEFAVDVAGSSVSDNPTPRLAFAAVDRLSGIARYRIRVDNGERAETRENEFTLGPLPPGSHRVSVTAFDRAGNSREAVAEIETVPIAGPVVAFLTPFLAAGEEAFVMKGAGAPGNTVHVTLFNVQGEPVAEGSTTIDGEGNWVFSFTRGLRKGEYAVRVFVEDERGAQSLPVAAGAVLVRPRPIVKIGIVELTAGQVLFIFLLAGAGGAYWVKRRRDLYRVRYGLVEYDFNKMMRLLERDITALTAKLETPGSEGDAENAAIEMRHTLAALQSTVEKMKGYLSREVRKLRR